MTISILVKAGVILIGLAIFGYAEVWAEDWTFYARTDKYLCFYDSQSITRPSKNIVRVWVKREYTDKGVIKMVKDWSEKYENISHSIVLEEINCSGEKVRILSLIHYSKEGKVMYRDSNEGLWNYVGSGSVVEALYKAVCK